MLGVPKMLSTLHGAVSEPVARAMAEGALARSMADVTIAVTGVAGPGGGSDEKPVGLVHFACAGRGRPTVAHHEVFPGDRAAVRDAAVQTALSMLRRPVRSELSGAAPCEGDDSAGISCSRRIGRQPAARLGACHRQG